MQELQGRNIPISTVVAQAAVSASAKGTGAQPTRSSTTHGIEADVAGTPNP